MVQKLITQELGFQYATHLKGTQPIGIHVDVMGMNDSNKESNYQKGTHIYNSYHSHNHFLET